MAASSENYKLFKKLSDNYLKYSTPKVKNKNEAQMTVAKMWNEIKLKYLNIDDRENEVTRLINDWMKTYTENKMKRWGNFIKPNKAKPTNEKSTRTYS